MVEPDLVDRIFEYIAKEMPHVKDVAKHKEAVRAEFGGESCYVAKKSQADRAELTAKILALFNGRNPVEVARKLGISRATVYRKIKQPGKQKTDLQQYQKSESIRKEFEQLRKIAK